MRLITDTNILVRCIKGRAGARVAALVDRGASLFVTHHHVGECIGVLMRVFGIDGESALACTTNILKPFEVIDPDQYQDYRRHAERRLRPDGKSDWPALAAAMATGCDIWSEDVDFFGTGIAVWSSRNVLECAIEKE